MSEHTETEERLRRINLVLRAIRGVNQLIVRQKDREKLISSICRILVETRSYYNAWVALLGETGEFLMAAEAGLGRRFLPMLHRLQSGEFTRCGREAIEQPAVVVTSDPISACTDCPLSEEYGGRGGMTARLEHDGRVYGLLCASIPANLAADGEELSLFREVAQDIGLALHGIRVEQEHKQAEDALKRSESRYRALFENAGEAIFLCSADGTIVSVNRTCEALTGYSADHLEGKSIGELFSPEDRQVLGGLLSLRPGVRRAGDIEEFRLAKKDRTEASVRLTVAPVLGADQPVALQVIASDVTEERRLRQNMQYYITQITRAQEDERLRISRELHDDTAQALAGLSRDMGLVIRRNRGLPEPVVENLERMRATVDSALEGVRRYSQDLRPSILDDLGLLPALEWLVTSLGEERGIAGSIREAGERYRLSPEQELSVFRIFRRHSAT